MKNMYVLQFNMLKFSCKMHLFLMSRKITETEKFRKKTETETRKVKSHERYVLKNHISKRILFKKITIMPKGQQPKIRCAVCNIPIQADAVSNVLPRPSDNDGVILVKLKRKIEFKGHVYFESVCPRFVEIALNYLKEHNHFYSNVLINLDNINRDLLCLSDIESIVEKSEFDIFLENDENDENLEINNPLDLHGILHSN